MMYQSKRKWRCLKTWFVKYEEAQKASSDYFPRHEWASNLEHYLPWNLEISKGRIEASPRKYSQRKNNSTVQSFRPVFSNFALKRLSNFCSRNPFSQIPNGRNSAPFPQIVCGSVPLLVVRRFYLSRVTLNGAEITNFFDSSQILFLEAWDFGFVRHILHSILHFPSNSL